MSSTNDFLGGLPAKSDTVVPGRWILNLPTSSSSTEREESQIRIRIRRFKTKERAAISSRGGLDDVWEQIRDDTLDKAWRRLQKTNDEDHLKPEPADIFRDPLATIVPAKSSPQVDAGDEKAQIGRVLWLFALTTEDASASTSSELDELEEILPALEPVSISSTLACKTHGSSLSCLEEKSTCAVSFHPSNQDIADAWDNLSWAVVERLAWNGGSRITRSSVSVSLRPYSPTTLVLDIKPLPLPACKPSSALLPSPNVRPCVIQPLHLPAITLSPFHPSQHQEAHLDTVFDDVLGSKWRDGRRTAKIKAGISNRPWSEWHVLWVPSFSTLDPTQWIPIELVGQWQKGQGILTVWPTHLIHDLISTAGGVSRKRKFESSIAFGLPPSEDVLGWSANVFEVLSAYKEPLPEPPTASLDASIGESGATGMRLADLTPEERMDTSPTMEDPKPVKEDSGSDLEDLFSSKSSPIENPPASSPVEDLLQGELNLEELFDTTEEAQPMELDRDLITSPVGGNGAGYAFPGLETEDPNLVTEDDFAFFDSSPQGLDLDITGDQEENIDEEGKENDSVAKADETETRQNPGDLLVPSSANDLPKETMVEETPADVTAETEHIPDAAEEKGPESIASPPLEATVLSPPTSPTPISSEHRDTHSKNDEHPIIKPYPFTELIPTTFEALPLQSSSNHLSSSIYLPPSPALTPESLRGDLVDRLKPSKNDRTDYASAWNSGSESSDSEDEAEWSGAPPTPDSDDDLDSSGRPSIEPQERRMSGEEEILFNGVRCVASEWIWLHDEKKWIRALSRPWHSSWLRDLKFQPAITQSSDQATTSLGNKILSAIDVNSLVNEIIWNSHFRNLLVPKPSEEDNDSGNSELGKLGINLGQISVPSENGNRLPDCNVHTGLNGNILRSSIASLKYWRQLGLSPAGGKKDILPRILCEASPGATRAARQFMTLMGQTYESLGLGSHTPEEDPSKVYIAVQASMFPQTLAMLHQKMLSEETQGDQCRIVYVLFNQMSAAVSPSALQLFFSSGLSRSLSKSSLIQVISMATIQPRSLQDLAFQTYNRFSRQIQTVETHGHPLNAPPAYLQYPSFTLAPDTLPKVSFTMQWPLRSYDLLNKWRWTHAAYTISADLELIIGVVVDSEGENVEVKTWKWSDGESSSILETVWDWFTDFAKMTATEWRMSITRLGRISTDEYETWIKLCDVRNAHLSLIVTDPPSTYYAPSSRSRPTVTSIAPSILTDPATRLHDDTLTSYLASMQHRQAVPVAQSSSESKGSLYAQKSFVLSIANSSPSGFTSAVYHVLHHISLPEREEEIDKVLGREYQKLTCLGRLRFGHEESGLPVHVENVRCILQGLLAVAKFE